MRYRVIVADPPWPFDDKLTMSDVKRGSASNYDTMTVQDLKDLDVKSISANDSVLALWVPSSLLIQGIDVMRDWGFMPKQTHVWVKTKKVPLKLLIDAERAFLDDLRKAQPDDLADLLSRVDISRREFQYPQALLDSMLAFGMGRLFRQTHEICIIGTRGSPYRYLKNKSQRSVHFAPPLQHSSKPEALQDMLGKMFPRVKKLEMFARRDRKGWTCVGLECPSTMGEDIRDSIARLKGGRKRRNENVAA